ncbi:hypothetical protein AALO_G00122180 [Alosa alosa]|uniref:Uncharacterized protein n=1 Tax=Alosa alosa TaxID=278164 RepID=A0AAV6GK53_9TELE|nr:hypothetical protein AALO_G00122180 [Alosa alosa]
MLQVFNKQQDRETGDDAGWSTVKTSDWRPEEKTITETGIQWRKLGTLEDGESRGQLQLSTHGDVLLVYRCYRLAFGAARVIIDYWDCLYLCIVPLYTHVAVPTKKCASPAATHTWTEPLGIKPCASATDNWLARPHQTSHTHSCPNAVQPLTRPLLDEPCPPRPPLGHNWRSRQDFCTGFEHFHPSTCPIWPQNPAPKFCPFLSGPPGFRSSVAQTLMQGPKQSIRAFALQLRGLLTCLKNRGDHGLGEEDSLMRDQFLLGLRDGPIRQCLKSQLRCTATLTYEDL